MKIAISGPMCSGKTTVANLICELYPEYKIFSFGKKIKEIAKDLFHMGEVKDRSLLISIANSMKSIDENVWINYIINECKDEKHCLIDDLRFKNELNELKKDNWYFIVLQVDYDTRVQRIKNLYPNNYEDHIKNMKDISERGLIDFSLDRTLYINTNSSKEEIKELIKKFISLKNS